MSEVLALGDVADVVAGVGFPKDMQGGQVGAIPVFKVGDISAAWLQGKSLLNDSRNYLSVEEAKSLGKCVAAGATVFAKIGEALRLNRRVMLGRDALVDNNVMGLVPKREKVAPKYLSYFMQTVDLGELSRSTTVPSIRKSDVVEISIPVPALVAQDEIVAELEKQFSRLDEAVANLQRVKANLKRYKASVLKAAVEGRLVETDASLARREGRTYETGGQLLQRILEGRPSAWKGKYDSPTPPECPDDAVTPDGWTWITVSQAMRERIVNGLSIKESATPTSVRALKLSAMSDQGLDFDDFRWLPIELSKVEDIVIRESDFFVSRGNGSLELVGRGSPAQGPKQAVIFPDTMMRIRFSQVVNVGPWFHALWTTRLVRTQIEKRVKTTAGIYKMAQPELASITVPLPPLAEQARIVAEVDRHLSIIREVEAEVDANLKRAQALRQSVLSRWFKNSAN